ncbi:MULTISPECIES: ATP-binding cassette domain-containing protein [Halomonadaceae]|uniref:ATP-binding cassette domain-containing protein n=1 Tax=unclassified Halomonas TaxID=2609666 RepID=UPI001597E6A1|nr:MULTISPECIES: ATP-binding cassette domain-containing protein [Halomonas]QJQ95235.1 ATP-binding cassette domain-containing protein [Halomonas sp. PA5]
MLSLENAGFTTTPALVPFSDRLVPGELLAIVGPNGAGKSTLISLLSGYRRAEMGSVSLDGQALQHWQPQALARRRALVAQKVALGFDWPVIQLVALGGQALPERVAAALAALDLTPLARRGAMSLSGGETQRVMIARALCQLGQPGERDAGGILLLDEPTSALDIGQQQRLMRLLRRLAEQHGMAICCVLHDLNLAARYAHRIWLLERGSRIASGAPGEVLTASRLIRVFGVELESCIAGSDGAPVLRLAP